MKEIGKLIQEVNSHKSELDTCDSIFTTNGAGLEGFS